MLSLASFVINHIDKSVSNTFTHSISQLFYNQVTFSTTYIFEGARCLGGSEVGNTRTIMNRGNIIMATTGELRAIIEELQLIDVGDAASYLGEEALVDES